MNVLTEKEANSLSRTPASEVFDFIISECEEVAPELPVSYSALDNDAAGGSNPEAGRVTQGTALALKARAALYRASKLFSGGEDRNLWREAAVANKAVIDYCTANGIRLGKYTDIWGTDNYQASEMIFVRRIEIQVVRNILISRLVWRMPVPVIARHKHWWMLTNLRIMEIKIRVSA